MGSNPACGTIFKGVFDIVYLSLDSHFRALIRKIDGANEVCITTYGINVLQPGRILFGQSRWGASFLQQLQDRKIATKIIVGLPLHDQKKAKDTIQQHKKRFPKFNWFINDSLHVKMLIFRGPKKEWTGFVTSRNLVHSPMHEITIDVGKQTGSKLHSYFKDIQRNSWAA